jgi:hypothetical protein
MHTCEMLTVVAIGMRAAVATPSGSQVCNVYQQVAQGDKGRQVCKVYQESGSGKQGGTGSSCVSSRYALQRTVCARGEGLQVDSVHVLALKVSCKGRCIERR